ncbi:histidine phosphatase family protein [Ferviditalea candida]|uniref:Histidine phosphatase family protein n=1 Tax=Ferviditalea candida TaxID=3108399 RepID=A0ABU5ZHS2_9BACL|nr:histidine phosphatase family protein [Paenibacillaceae bacterium T2]
MTLYFMRHGETEWNRQNRIQGRKDVCLNEKGMKQVHDASKWLIQNSIVIHRIVSSPLQRAAQSALLIAEKRGLPIEFNACFAERGFGELEGLTFGEIAAKFNIHDPENMDSSLYGVESITELYQRVWQGLCTLSEPNTENVLIVTHGSIIRILTGIPEIVRNGMILPYCKS